jgi:hypothetical protein
MEVGAWREVVDFKYRNIQNFKTEEEVYGFLRNVDYFPEMDSET